MSTHNTFLLLFGLIDWFLFVSSIGVDYFVEQYTDASNVFGQVPNPDKSTEYVKYLGNYNSLQECVNACVNNSTKNKCETLTYMTSTYNVNTYKKHCYGRYGRQYSSVWTAVPDSGAIAARIIYPCTSNLECSLNGKCISGNCTCNPGWNGYHCGILDLQPATKAAGYVYEGNISTWGGAVLVDKSDESENTKYHMYLAQFDNHCGVNAWVPNSRVVHAQSTKGFNSQYVFRDTVHGPFSHEPVAVYGPNDEFVITYIAQNFTGPECQCKDGSTPPDDGCNPSGNDFVQLMQWSDSPNGPWSEPAEVIEISGMDDPNLSGVILKNGSFVGLGRNWVSGYSSVYVVTSENWKNGRQYKMIATSLFPQLVGGGAEDQFVYQDCDGNFHAIFNNQSPNYGIYVCGGHAYSSNGIDWIYTGYAFGNNVEYTDQSSFVFTRRERPHLVFAEDGCTPIALTNGAQYGGRYGDATETLLQPLGQ